MNSGLITRGDFSDYNANITRSQMAYVFFNSLPTDEFKAINAISSIPDVSVSHKYYHEIIGLYSAGILTGSDSMGTFHPSNNITRAEAAAIISRVSKADLRKTFSISGSTSSGLNSQQISSNCSAVVAFVEVYDASSNAFGSGSGFLSIQMVHLLQIIML